MKQIVSALMWPGRFILGACLLFVLPARIHFAGASQYDGRIRSEHIRIKIPLDREWLGREAVVDLEQCWQYMNRVTGGSLPRVVLVDIDWTKRDNSANPVKSSISIGMSRPGASYNLKEYLLQSAARELARLGLAELSRTAVLREENQLLLDGMSEILAREYDLSAKGLTGAWVIAHFLDRIRPLSLEALTSGSRSTEARRDLSSAAPAITFLMACREQHGRERLLKLFEALKKGSLKEALTSTFRSSVAVLEDVWLRKVRGFNDLGDFVATSADDAPHLRKTVLVPPAGRAGASIQMRMIFQDATDNLDAGSVFVEEKGSGTVLRARELVEKGERLTLVDFPVSQKQQPGNYSYRITAVDESGNVRNWEGAYTVEP